MIINRIYGGYILRIAIGTLLFAILLLVGSMGAAPYTNVTNSSGNNASVIDTATNNVTATTSVGVNPVDVVVNSAGTPTPTAPTVSIIADPATHDTVLGTSFTFTANPVGSWGNNIRYSWSITNDKTNPKCSGSDWTDTRQSISAYAGCTGTHTLSVTARDEKGNVANDTYLVTVHENATPTPTIPPTPGWYRNGAGAILYENNAGQKITWQNSYIYPHPGEDNLYWYAEVIYSNNGSQTWSLTCNGFSDPALAKENMRGTANAGIVAADETFCSRNPNFTRTLNPGETHKSWAIFHNVPNGGEVSLEWSYPGNSGSSSWVNPWYSPFNATPPAECPSELAKIGLCNGNITQSEQPLLKAPWEGVKKITQGNKGTTSHYDHGTWDNTYAIDVNLTVGDNILAPANGIVEYIDNDTNGSGGKELAINHSGPTGKYSITVYLHLSEILVKENEFVKQGQVVAKSGNTGISTGPHLHFHIWRPPGDYDAHTMPIERLVMKQVDFDPDFKEYNASKGELDDNKIGGKSFESNNKVIQ